jgi:hypothetical protein
MMPVQAAATSVAAMLTGCGGLAIIEGINAVDPKALSSWEGVSFKVFLILCLLVSMSINIWLARFVAMRFIAALEKNAEASKAAEEASDAVKEAAHHMSNATKRCLKNQGIILEGE